MFPIINDIAIKKDIRPERPMAVASVAVVSLVSIIAAGHGIGKAYTVVEILAVSIPASLVGVLMVSLWSLRRGKDLDKDLEFQAKI
jgi:anaerobic C4-dicarboxylate transporter DcuB